MRDLSIRTTLQDPVGYFWRRGRATPAFANRPRHATSRAEPNRAAKVIVIGIQ